MKTNIKYKVPMPKHPNWSSFSLRVLKATPEKRSPNSLNQILNFINFGKTLANQL